MSTAPFAFEHVQSRIRNKAAIRRGSFMLSFNEIEFETELPNTL
jgi:hypothetical protein